MLDERGFTKHHRAFVNYCRRRGDTVTAPPNRIIVDYADEEQSNMATATGKITQVNAKPWKDNRKGTMITLHSFRIDGHNLWFRTGTEPLPFPEGTTISFEYDENKQQVDLSTVKEAAAGAAPTASAGAGARPNTGNAREDYWQEKERHYKEVEVPRISFSAAQDRAISVVTAALAHDALSFGNATKGKKLDMLLDYVDEVSNRFFLQSMYAHERFKALEDGDVLSTATDATSADEAVDPDFEE